MKKLITLCALLLCVVGLNAQTLTITWSAEDVGKASDGELMDSYGTDGFVLTRTADTNNKHAIDGSNAEYGNTDEHVKFTHRFKTGGKSSSSNALSLSIPYAGTLKVYVLPSGTSDERTLVLTQGTTSLYNEVIKGEKVGDYYPIVSVPVEEGTVKIEYPVNGLNFHAFELVKSAAPTQATAPIINVSGFDFDTKDYSMTITATGADEIWYSIDDATEVKYTGAVTLTGTEKKVMAYAKAEGLDDSEKVTEELNLATYDDNKKYVAWIYQVDYNGNTLEGDIIYQALAKEYNVVPVAAANRDADPATVCPSLASADLLVITEMMQGGDNYFATKLKDYIVGKLPVIGLKAFNYTNGRWSWASTTNAPANHAGTKEFLPASNYVLFADLVNNGKIALYEGEISGNTIQTSGLDGTDAPNDAVVMGTIDGNTTKNVVTFYSASKMYFGLHLSCDNYDKYHENAATIVTRAAEKLLASEDLAETAPLSVEITDAGWATLYTGYALDFSAVEGLTAYTATCDEETVTLTEVQDVPAGTGVVLKGEEKTYNVPMAATSTTVKGGLEGSTTEATAYDADEDNDLYVLALNEEGTKVQFRKLISGSIAAGKAYLKVGKPDAGESRVLNVVIAGETTGINEAVVNSEQTTGTYNLNGQRVAQPTKGLYIVNGKKVIVK